MIALVPLFILLVTSQVYSKPQYRPLGGTLMSGYGGFGGYGSLGNMGLMGGYGGLEGTPGLGMGYTRPGLGMFGIGPQGGMLG